MSSPNAATKSDQPTLTERIAATEERKAAALRALERARAAHTAAARAAVLLGQLSGVDEGAVQQAREAVNLVYRLAAQQRTLAGDHVRIILDTLDVLNQLRTEFPEVP